LKVTYTEEAVADIVEAITYLNDRNPTAAANLDAQIAQCIDRLARNSTALSRVCDPARLCEVGPSRRFASTTSATTPSC
jgi:plasmid stabilization system protein ParE